MAKAIWKGVVLAESGKTVIVEGNHYFPPDAIKREHFRENTTHTTCTWKGSASYYDLEVDGEVYESGAWTYHDPSKSAERIKDYVAFYIPAKG